MGGGELVGILQQWLGATYINNKLVLTYCYRPRSNRWLNLVLNISNQSTLIICHTHIHTYTYMCVCTYDCLKYPLIIYKLSVWIRGWFQCKWLI